MITMNTLVFIIASFCGFKDPKLTREQKEVCMEFFINCSIIEDGKTTNKVIDDCREKWMILKK